VREFDRLILLLAEEANQANAGYECRRRQQDGETAGGS
jgi:hypothetical protein